MLELKPFVDALRRKDIKRAKEWFEGVSPTLGLGDEFLAGYRFALQGMLSALEAGSEMSVIWKIVNDKSPREEIERLLKSMREMASHSFRSKDELGYSRAWSDFLSAWLR